MNIQLWIPIVMALVSLLWNYLQSQKILELQKAAERTNLIHKYQFEKEFKLYEDLWGGLIEVRTCALSLRPVMDFSDATKTDEQIKLERLTNYYNSLNSVAALFEKNKPFYPESIFNQIFELLKITRFEAISYQHKDRREERIGYWEEAEKNSKEILDRMDKIAYAIRKRVSLPII